MSRFLFLIKCKTFEKWQERLIKISPSINGWTRVLIRKEVIHPQLRLGIPCYDLSLIINLYLPRKRCSIAIDFAALTGGVYKTR